MYTLITLYIPSYAGVSFYPTCCFCFISILLPPSHPPVSHLLLSVLSLFLLTDSAPLPSTLSSSSIPLIPSLMSSHSFSHQLPPSHSSLSTVYISSFPPFPFICFYAYPPSYPIISFLSFRPFFFFYSLLHPINPVSLLTPSCSFFTSLLPSLLPSLLIASLYLHSICHHCVPLPSRIFSPSIHLSLGFHRRYNKHVTLHVWFYCPSFLPACFLLSLPPSVPAVTLGQAADKLGAWGKDRNQCGS